MNFKARELSFCLKDKSQFDEAALKRALQSQRFPNVQVKTRSQESGVRSQESGVRNQSNDPPDS